MMADKKIDQSSISAALANKAGAAAPAEKKKTVFDLIQSMEGEFKRALPEHVGVERFVRVAITVVRTNQKLMQCEGMSIVAALMQSAQLGLEPNTPLKEAHIIPYRNKRIIDGQVVWVEEAQFQPGYRGIAKLVWNSGLVSELEFDVICENDTVIYEKGNNGTFKHIPNFKGDRGEAYAYYAYAVMKGGGFVCTVMSKETVIKHALKFSKSQKNKEMYGPWKDDFDSMALKTVLLALCDKKLPKSTTQESVNLQRAVSSDGTIKREVADDMSEVIDVTDWSGVHEDEATDVEATDVGDNHGESVQ
ncbi:recombinase RecT [Paenibacillus sp. NPDC058367]|uniref:recombinase RecT n=1 Tax=Paenibacillus sp. NPDC058367 TaxID=3346460 RepID=UPI003655D21C